MSMFNTAMFLETMENVRDNIHKWAKDWGFWDERDSTIHGECSTTGSSVDYLVRHRPWNFGEKIALIHSELSEALEKHRKHLGKGEKDLPDEHCPEFGGVEIELADAAIRLLDLCGKMQIDLGRAILAKMAFNRTRPKKHGKAY